MTISSLISGTVVKGSGDGTKIGFPTANIKIAGKTSLKHGVYACLVYINSKVFKGALHYGPRMVFDETEPQLEVYILGFSDNIYGQKIKIEVIKYIRITKKFKTIESLRKQIEDDVIKINIYLLKKL